MTHVSEEEFLEMQRRVQRIISPSPNHFIDTEADEGPESALQSKIKAFCKQRGWPILCFVQTRDVSKYLPPGWPDITVKLPSGQTLDIETKSRNGKLRKEQERNQLIWMHLGHTIHVVRSFKGFLKLIDEVFSIFSGLP